MTEGHMGPGTSDPLTASRGPGGVEEAVEQLIDEVGTEVSPDPILSLHSLRGRVAIVTGGASGIGRATAMGLARNGVHVAFNYLDEGGESRQQAEDVAKTLREMEVSTYFAPCDVRSSNAVNAFVESAAKELGGVHFLINNAGIGQDRALWRMTDEEWRAVLDTNLTGAFYFTRAVAPYLRSQEFGKIVNFSSVHAMTSEFGLANYCASKAGLIGLTRSSAVDLGPCNVNVNAVAPGYIRTTQLTDRVPAELMDKAREDSVLKRLGDPQDVAAVILFLCSEVARHLTGAVIPVDGGYLL
ncbi:MAG: SDR family NAD(P)-dependent oxidoreductase [Longimicrobiales bacterium]